MVRPHKDRKFHFLEILVIPELLAELNEEQKQILFFKMREEQIRRWKEREARLEKGEGGVQKRIKGKSVSWMPGSDNDVWVWVMGEHPNDKPYDQICDEIMAERAARQAQQEAEDLRAKKEAELEKRFSTVHLDTEVLATLREQQRQEEAKQAAAKEQKRLEDELKRKEAEERRRVEEELRKLEEERTQQIYMDLKDVQKSQKVQEKEDKAWRDTLRKSKAADLRRRSIAKQAREEHKRRSVRALEHGRVAAVSKVFGVEKPPLPPKPKPRNLTIASDAINQKPGVSRSLSSSSRDHIIQWFREDQMPLRAGFQNDQKRIATWFHGIISRQEAESLLSEKDPGHFLVRVSERIMGYVLSYRGTDEGFKHFLIDATDSCYMLLGDQLKFSSLADLVEYHEVEPLTSSGGELLLHPCGQKSGNVDYADLFR